VDWRSKEWPGIAPTIGLRRKGWAIGANVETADRSLDREMMDAWRQAVSDLGIRLVIPFTFMRQDGEVEFFEGCAIDFRGAKGTVFGRIDGRKNSRENRKEAGYCASDLSDPIAIAGTIGSCSWILSTIGNGSVEKMNNPVGTREKTAGRSLDPGSKRRKGMSAKC
jgi:hypothetical protein